MKQLPLLQSPPPRTRAECVGGREARMAGKELCERVLCRHHLIGAIANWSSKSKKHEDQAVESMRAWLDGEFDGHCVLDIVDTGRVSDEKIAKMLCMQDAKTVTRRCAEAKYELRQRMPAWMAREKRQRLNLTFNEFDALTQKKSGVKVPRSGPLEMFWREKGNEPSINEFSCGNVARNESS